MFIVCFCLLFSLGTMILDHGGASAGTFVGSLLTAGVIAAVVKPKGD